MALGHKSFPLDIADAGNYYLVYASLPGIKPEDVQVDVQGTRLTIHGECQEEQEQHGHHWIARERRMGALQRSVRLPTPIKAGQIESRYEHGVVTLMIPKADESLPGHRQTDTQLYTSRHQPGHAAPTGAIPHAETDRVDEASMDSFPASDPPSWSWQPPG